MGSAMRRRWFIVIRYAVSDRFVIPLTQRVNLVMFKFRLKRINS